MKEKVYNNEKYIKAWLCARGFEEKQNFRTDSPTCSRGLRLACSLIASSYWTVSCEKYYQYQYYKYYQ